jgi:signal transduction histidine kinase
MDFTNTPERRKIFHFTQPYIEYRNVLAVRGHKTDVEMSIEQLSKLTFAVLKGWASTIHLEQHYPNMKLYYAHTPLDALMAVSTGKADAHVVHEINNLTNFACHQAQINQVLMNLIVNACDAIQQKQLEHNATQLGKITINCRLFEGQIEVSITDDGCGMSEQTKNKLFEPFYTTNGVGEGTGLGMAICSA